MDTRITQLIDDFKAYYAVFGIMLWQHNVPEVQKIMAKDLHDPTSNIGAYRLDGSRYQIFVPPIIERSHTPEFNLFYLRMSMSTAISNITDEVIRLNIMDSSPELQFLRHLRNACAHGNRFYLKNGEPKTAAAFKGFEILANNDGFGPVLFDFIGTGDILDLLDHIQNL